MEATRWRGAVARLAVLIDADNPISAVVAPG
jgi:hypothetical protein